MKLLDSWKLRAVLYYRAHGWTREDHMTRALCLLVVAAGEKQIDRHLTLEEAVYLIADYVAWCQATEDDATTPDALTDVVRGVWRFITTEWRVRSDAAQ